MSRSSYMGPPYDTPSGSSNPSVGRLMMDASIRSILFHPASLLLFLELHKENVSRTTGTHNKIENECTSTDSVKVASSPHKRARNAEHDTSDHVSQSVAISCSMDNPHGKILEQSYNDATKENDKKKDSGSIDQMEMLLKNQIMKNVNEKKNSLGFESHKEFAVTRGVIDMVLECDDKILMVMEFSVFDKAWWAKFNQCMKYVEILYTKENLQHPVLMSVLTIEKDKDSNDARTKIGVFFCRPSSSDKPEQFRVSLLLHSNSKSVKEESIKEGSNVFGKVLSITSKFKELQEGDQDVLEHELASTFKKLLAHDQEELQELLGNDQEKLRYEYFSSNCCRLGGRVYRIYDNRYRPTERSPDVYLDENCKGIVGRCKQILRIEFDSIYTDNSSQGLQDDLWTKSNDDVNRSLTLISTPYRDGIHLAPRPTSFIPVIDQLKMLHEMGYVHGDIRAFNTIFSTKEDADEGWLIDFDFGGKFGRDDETIDKKKKYPSRYNRKPEDGIRTGRALMTIEPWHDWYALGQLIFAVHRLIKPRGVDDTTKLRVEDKWRYLDSSFQSTDFQLDKFCEEYVVPLTGLLRSLELEGWTVVPSADFLFELDRAQKIGATFHGATGSSMK